MSALAEESFEMDRAGLRQSLERFESVGLFAGGDVALRTAIHYVLHVSVAARPIPVPEARKVLRYLALLQAGAASDGAILPNGNKASRLDCRLALEGLLLPDARGRYRSAAGRPRQTDRNLVIMKTFEVELKEAREAGRRKTLKSIAKLLCEEVLPRFHYQRGEPMPEESAESLLRQYRRLRRPQKEARARAKAKSAARK